MKTTKQKIEVMQAFVDGKPIQYKGNDKWSTWKDMPVEPTWDWNYFDFRIKPEDDKE